LWSELLGEFAGKGELQMRPMFTLAVSAALTLWSLSPAFGAPKVKTELPSRQTEDIFASVDASANEIAEAAYKLSDDASRQRSPAAQFDGLQLLRNETNKIGNELQTLQAERSSLSPWELKALDEVTPLFHDAAVNADQSIQLYNSDRGHLFATAYVGDTMKTSQDASRAATLLHDYVKLAKTRERESKLEQTFGAE
jgi:hypothetical protein